MTASASQSDGGTSPAGVRYFCLSYPDTPPSFNKVGHSGSRWTWSRQKKLWQGYIEVMLLIEKVPRGLAKVEARAELWFPTKHRRDTVNYRTLLEKCLGDALVNGAWIEDDTPEFFSFTTIAFGHGPALTKLILAVP